MLSLWLTLSLLALKLHRLESQLFIPCALLLICQIMSGISAFRILKHNSHPLNPLSSFNTLSNGLTNTLSNGLTNTFSNCVDTKLYQTEVKFADLNPKIPRHFEDKIARRLDTDMSNPVGIVSYLIRDFFNSHDILKRNFEYFPVPFAPVTVSENFDELQVPLDHVSRDPKDSYYLSQHYVNTFTKLGKLYKEVIDTGRNGDYDRDLIRLMGKKFGHSEHKLLPTHTTSHITKLLRAGVTQAIYSGQVFRRDEIDSQHYPVFHQMDGYLLFTRQDIENLRRFDEFKCDSVTEVIFRHLKKTLENLITHLFQFVTNTNGSNLNDFGEMVKFGDMIKYWDDGATFPFTFPSSEYYLKNGEQPTELLGCGVLKNIIIHNNFNLKSVGEKDFSDKSVGEGLVVDKSVGEGLVCDKSVGEELVDDKSVGEGLVGGWAFGIGLERLAMVLCRIPDIRQFWETDERFLKQYKHSFTHKILPVFVKYSKNPPVVRDLSFYIADTFNEQVFREIILEKGKGYVEDIQFVSKYFNEKISKESLCYRVVYRAFEENLTNSFVNAIHQETLKSLENKLNLIIR